MIAGMDFGTTNSGMAVFDGRSVHLLPLDPSNNNPRIARTALYVTNDQAIRIGREAIDRYFEQNVGRPVKLQRVWIGELEIRGADMYYVTDAYAYVDVLSPGRLFLSMKTSLRDADYPGTVVGQFYYPLEDLIGLYLTATKIRAEKILGRELRQVVLGRPVHFSTHPEHDALAQSRLLRAAFAAGYEKVYLQYEPVAAAFSYERNIDDEENVLVFDFGGGTLDITVMRLGNPRRRQVLATGGVPVAGDVFDQKLVRAKLPRHFGEGSFYGPRHKALTVPQWIYSTFSNWQTILELQSAENKRILTEIAQTAQRRYQIEALINLVANNYGLQMFDIVEQAKRRLSEKRGTEILLEGQGFNVREFVTRTEFEQIIRHEIGAIEQHLDETLNASGLTPHQVDAVIRTGGSSQIPVFNEMLERKFGEDKVRRLDTFSSVAAGLGIIAHGIEAGEIEAASHVPETLPASDAPRSRPNVSPINLDLVQRRLLVDEMAPDQVGDRAATGLVIVSEEGLVTAITIEKGKWREAGALALPEAVIHGGAIQAIVAPLDERLLLVTSQYRFLLSTPRQLAELDRMELAITHLHQLEPYEKVCAVCSWDKLSEQGKLLLVTSSGYTRTYPMNILKANVEAPVPMKFDQPLPGIPITLAGAEGEEQLVIITNNGRAIRLEMQKVRTSGFQAMNCGPDDRVSAAVPIKAEETFLLVTGDGHGRRLDAAAVPLSVRENVKGRAVIARRSDVVASVSSDNDTSLWCLTSKRLARIEVDHLPLDDSTRSYELLSLDEGEAVHTALKVSSMVAE